MPDLSRRRALQPLHATIRTLSHSDRKQSESSVSLKNDVYNDFQTVGTSDASFTDETLPYVRTMAEVMLELRKYGPKDSLAIGREQATSDFVNNKYTMFIS